MKFCCNVRIQQEMVGMMLQNVSLTNCRLTQITQSAGAEMHLNAS